MTMRRLWLQTGRIRNDYDAAIEDALDKLNHQQANLKD